MPKLCDTPTVRVIFLASKLSVTDPIRDACRQRLAEMRDRYATAREMAAALGCSQRHLNRLLNQYGVRRWIARAGAKAFEAPARPRGWNLRNRNGDGQAVPANGAPHPPASFCSCEWCLRARGAA